MSRLARLFVILLLLAGAVWAVVERPWADPPRTVVLISIDTLRPERLGAYGNAPDVSPRIDALAREGVVFDQALALSPWTLPSHMTLLTGLDPVAHGVKRAGFVLSSRVTTLAESLRAAGFRTAAFTDGGFVHHEFGFGQGFEVYRDAVNPVGMVNGFARLLPEALEWMHSTRHEDSFVFLHTFDVHTPYQHGDAEVQAVFRGKPAPPGDDDYLLRRFGFLYLQRQQRVAEYQRMSELLRDYDAGVHEADRGVGQVLDLLAETGRLENALIIVVSDHGESFGDHGVLVGHGLALTDDELRVPLVIRFPGREGAGRRIGTLVDLCDVAPTVLESMGLPAPPEMQGESLLGLLRQRARRRNWSFGMSQNLESCFLVHDGFKYISPPALEPMEAAKRHLAPINPTGYPENGGEAYTWGTEENAVALRYDLERDPLGLRDVLPNTPQLYDRTNDPQERRDLHLQDPDRAKELAARAEKIYLRSLELHAQLDDGQVPAPMDPHTQQIIESLGYAGAASPEEAREHFLDLPLDLKAQAKLPWVPPDTSALDAIDRDVHIVRQAIAAGVLQPAGVQEKLQQFGNRYLKWLTEHPEFPVRVAWRCRELEQLAASAGVELDVDRWKGLMNAALGRPPKGK
ncbi:MAG TPA: sulfatase [Planctomycetota bacterium]|nr:sulfatase [Planctomycetota bacterium]